MTEAGRKPPVRGSSAVPRADLAAPCAGRRTAAFARIAPAVAAAMLAAGCSSMPSMPWMKSLKFWESSGDDEPVSTAPAMPIKPVPAPAGAVDSVVAVVDGDPITRRELDEYGRQSAPFLPADIRGNQRALLESMIEHRLLKAEFDKNGITAPDEMVDRYIDNVIKESGQTRAALEADVARSGLTWKQYHDRMREEVQRIQLVNLLIRSHVNVPEEEVREVWESDAGFLQSEQIEVGAIFIPMPSDPLAQAVAREKAIAVREEADDDFAAAAREHSQGPGASEGGSLGDFKRGTMAPHFEKALDGLDEGEVSQPVEGAGGIWIVKLIEVKEAGRRPFDEVKEELADKIYDKRIAERYRTWATEGLRRDHRIEYIAPDLQPLPIAAAPAFSSNESTGDSSDEDSPGL